MTSRVLSVLAVLLLSLPAQAQDRSVTVRNDTLESVTVTLEHDSVRFFMVYIEPVQRDGMIREYVRLSRAQAREFLTRGRALIGACQSGEHWARSSVVEADSLVLQCTGSSPESAGDGAMTLGHPDPQPAVFRFMSLVQQADFLAQALRLLDRT